MGSPCVPRRRALGSHGTRMISGPAVSGVTQLGHDPASWGWSCVAQCWGEAVTPATLEMTLEEVTANHDSAGVLAVFSTHPTPHSGSVFRSSRLACLDRKGRGAEAGAPQAASPPPSRTPPTPCPPVLAWAHQMTESPQGKREVPRSSPITLLSARETLSPWPDPWSPRLRDLPFPVAFCAPSSAHPHLLRRGPSPRLSTPHPTLPTLRLPEALLDASRGWAPAPTGDLEEGALGAFCAMSPRGRRLPREGSRLLPQPRCLGRTRQPHCCLLMARPAQPLPSVVAGGGACGWALSPPGRPEPLSSPPAPLRSQPGPARKERTGGSDQSRKGLRGRPGGFTPVPGESKWGHREGGGRAAPGAPSRAYTARTPGEWESSGPEDSQPGDRARQRPEQRSCGSPEGVLFSPPSCIHSRSGGWCLWSGARAA